MFRDFSSPSQRYLIHVNDFFEKFKVLTEFLEIKILYKVIRLMLMNFWRDSKYFEGYYIIMIFSIYSKSIQGYSTLVDGFCHYFLSTGSFHIYCSKDNDLEEGNSFKRYLNSFFESH